PETVRRLAIGGPYGKVDRVLQTVNQNLQEMQDTEAADPVLHKKCAKRTLNSLHEVQKLDRRELREALLDILLLPFQEYPTRHLVQLNAKNVNPHAHHAQ